MMHTYDTYTDCLPFRSTWIHTWLLVGLVLLNLQFSV